MEKLSKALREYDSISSFINDQKVKFCPKQETFFLSDFDQIIQQTVQYPDALISKAFDITYVKEALRNQELAYYFKMLASSRIMLYTLLAIFLVGILVLCLIGGWFGSGFWVPRYPQANVFSSPFLLTKRGSQSAQNNQQDDEQQTTLPENTNHSRRVVFFSTLQTKFQRSILRFFTSPFFFVFLSALSGILLISLSAALFYYIISFDKLQERAHCATFDLFEGYFFGSANYSSPRSDIPPNWKGIYHQLREIQKLASQLQFDQPYKMPSLPLSKDKAKPPVEGPTVHLCPACHDVLKHFFSDQGLANILTKEVEHMLELIQEYLIKYSVLVDIFNIDIDGASQNEINMELSSPDAFFMAPITYKILTTLIKNLGILPHNGPKILLQNLLTTFRPNHYIFEEAQEGLNIGLNNILSIDGQVKKIFYKWAKTSVLLRPFVRILVAISFILGAVGCLLGGFSIFFAFIFWKYFYLPRWFRKASLGIVIGSVAVSCIAFLIFAILRTGFGVLQEGCKVSSVLFLREGLWNHLPSDFSKPSLFKTDQWLLLDTCLKHEGDGDITAALGIRRSVERVRQWSTFELQKMNHELNTKFDNVLRKSVLSSSLFYIQNAPYFAVIPPFAIENSYYKHNSFLFPLPFPDGVNYVSFLQHIPENLTVSPVANLAGESVTSVGSLVKHVLNFLTVRVTGIHEVFDRANNISKSYLGNVTFCTTYLKKNNQCDSQTSQIFISLFVTKDDIETSVVCNETHMYYERKTCEISPIPLRDPLFHNLTSQIEKSSAVHDIVNLHRYIFILAIHDYYMRFPLPETIRIPNTFEEIPELMSLAEDYNLLINKEINIEQYTTVLFPDMTCLSPNKTRDLSDYDCRYGNLLNNFAVTTQSFVHALSYGFDQIANGVMVLQQNVQKTMESLLEAGKKVLEDSNCHFLGSSLNVLNQVTCILISSYVNSLSVIFLLLCLIIALSAISNLSIYRIDHFKSN